MFSITTIVNGLLTSPRVQHVLRSKMVGSRVVWDGAQLTLCCSFERWGDSSLFFLLILCRGKWNIKAISWRVERQKQRAHSHPHRVLSWKLAEMTEVVLLKALIRTLIDLESNLSETWFVEPHPASLQRSVLRATSEKLKQAHWWIKSDIDLLTLGYWLSLKGHLIFILGFTASAIV